MGGTALKTPTRRYQADEYHRAAGEVIAQLRRELPHARMAPTKAYGDKADFGDLDVIVDAESPEALMPVVRAAFGDVEIYHDRNAAYLSFPYHDLQVDLLCHPGREFDSACRYFNFNDLSNLIGRVAARLGFRYTHRGLAYTLYREGTDRTHELGRFILTDDPVEMFSFLGYDQPGGDLARYEQGFATREAMFDFATKSRYFCPDVYLLENRNHRDRARDRKRKTYRAFLDYLKAKALPPGPVIDRDAMLTSAFERFPAFAGAYRDAVRAEERRAACKARFNGKMVAKATGLVGVELGLHMGRLRERLGTDEERITLVASMTDAQLLAFVVADLPESVE